MAVKHELQAEQEFVDLAYARLDAMRSDANRMLEGVLDLGKGGTFQSRTERDVIVRTSLARLEQLDIGDQALTFGRIDRVVGDGNGSGPPAAEASDGLMTETFHIGRLAVHGADHEPLVVDWRAPVAEPFYRATGRDPQGLVLRRHLALDGRSVVGVEDEWFAVDGAPAGTNGSGAATSEGATTTTDGTADADGSGELILGDGSIGGPGALLAALDRARSGHMQDIVSTIQREQDEIIRSPLPGVMVVQGGPGTGKTAVALHRAAYLLYTHRFPLERQGVLVVGPNPLFLRYIEQVLPSLGETGVTLSTVSGLVPEVRARDTEPEEVARLKGDVRMSKVIGRAVRTRQRPLADDVTIPYGALLLRLSAADTREIVATARRRPGSHNARRRVVEQGVVGILAERARRTQQTLSTGSSANIAAFPGYEDPSELDDDEFDLEDFSRKVRRVPELAAALDRMWPRLSPHELLHDLFGAPALIRAAGRGSLSAAEEDLLFRKRSDSFEAVPWTPADAALIDEARHLLGPRNGNGDDGIRNYGHIVVDEVQDLSPMQLRMLTRRSLSGSMTVVGDIAQATAPWAPQSWSDITSHLPKRRPPKLVELTVSYRTPAEVVEVAAKVLAVAAPELKPPTPVRKTGVPPRVVAVAHSADDAAPTDTVPTDTVPTDEAVLTVTAPTDDAALTVTAPTGTVPTDTVPTDTVPTDTVPTDTVPTDDAVLARAVARAAAEEMTAVGSGRVAVLAPSRLLTPIATALAEAGTPVVDPRDMRRGGLSDPLVLLAADAANGLEFDSVVVAEPSLIAGTTARGLRTLYVAMTRPTQRLTLVHAAPLPAPLADLD